MRARFLRTALLTALLATLTGAGGFAAEPVRHIPVYVEPFYRAARTPDEAPQVSVGGPYTALLASTKRENVLAVRDMILGKPGLTTPMTMMVLAIRLYDFGLRDEAVFWFYAAKDRYFTLAEVIAPGTRELAQSAQAMAAFSQLAGPYINGYAFCDVEKQKQARVKALAWVEANPYQAVFMEQLPARDKDRKALLKEAVAKARGNLEKEQAHLADPKNLEALHEGRKQNEMDEKFCWPQ